MNILIIDDEPITSLNLKAKLEKNKFKIKTSDNYNNALKQAIE